MEADRLIAPPTPALTGVAVAGLPSNEEEQNEGNEDDNDDDDNNDIHPPNVVTLSPVADPDTPLPDSPLSSPPDSPRSLSSREIERLQNSCDAPERPRQPKEAEILLERRSSLELPRMMSPFEVVKEETTTTEAKMEQQPKSAIQTGIPSAPETPFDEGHLNRTNRNFPRYRGTQNITAKEDSDAPDDEKKLDDSSQIPSSRRKDEKETLMEDLTTSQLRAEASFRTTGVNQVGLQATSFQSTHTFEGDEIMSTEGEPPSLQINDAYRRSIAELQKKYSSQLTPIKSAHSKSREENGELPFLASPPPPSPPLELNLASPESSTATSGNDPPSLSLPAPKVQVMSPKRSVSVEDCVDSSASMALDEPPSLSTISLIRTRPLSIADNIAQSRSKTTGDLPTKNTLATEVKKGIRSPSTTSTKKTFSSSLDRPNRVTRDTTNSSHNTNRFVEVDREQHLKFAALKRDIISRPKSLLSPVQHRIEKELRREQHAGRDSKDSSVSHTTLDCTAAADDDDNSNVAEITPAVSPDGETDALEVSLMVSPNGEIDYQKTILNIVPQDKQRHGAELTETIIYSKASEGSSGNRSSNITNESTVSQNVDTSEQEDYSLEEPVISRSASEGSTDQVQEKKYFEVPRSQHIIQRDTIFVKKVQETSETTSAGSQSQNAIRPSHSDGGSSPSSRALRLASLDGGSSSPAAVLRSVNSEGGGSYLSSRAVTSVKSTSGSGSRSSGYVPPNQAWSDYLTFRGVAVDMSKRKSKENISNEVRRTLSSEEDGVPCRETFNAAAPEQEESNDQTALDLNSAGFERQNDSPLEQTSQEHSSTPTPLKAKPAFREMTPKKDLQGSEKSSEWLQAELRRRAFVKQEINSAIEGRGKVMSCVDSDDKSEDESKPRSGSLSEMDEEVAAINAEEEMAELLSSIVQSPSDGRIPGNNSTEEPPPRRLFGADEDANTENNNFATFDNFTGSEDDEMQSNYEDVQMEMRKFASETRAALRDQSFTEKVLSAAASSKFMPLTPPSPVVIDTNSLAEDPSIVSTQKQPTSVAPSVTGSAYTKSGSKRLTSGTRTQHSTSTGSDFIDFTLNETPVLIRSMDYFEGIAKGDITLSLLSENTGSGESSVAATWANRVRGAIWRSRNMRRNMKDRHQEQMHSLPGSPARSRVARSSRTVASTQDAALLHLQRDEIDEAIELFEDIIFAYYSFFERSLSNREKYPGAKNNQKPVDFQLYIGVALHNLGVLNLLRGDYDEALSYFSRAVENRRSHLGREHPDHISSMVKLAICRYAVNEFAEAHARLEEALVYARRSCITIDDRMLMAEILNNLGCLAYMCGQPVAANGFYRDSMDVQFGVLSDSLYAGNSTWGRTISLNISITRANIGFIKLVTKELPVAVTALENALMEQQILLRGGHETIIATMDHLAVANLLHGDQEKAALMFSRILDLQQKKFGPRDPRCFVTIDKINMVQGRGGQYNDAIEALHRTFTMPEASSPVNEVALDECSKSTKGSNSSRTSKKKSWKMSNSQGSKQQSKPQRNKVIKVLNSIRKMKP
ncbi:tetratricopeptide repeat protein [Nitzschia inconspicua]|uniref:Tetratricopeptide repeat protein n=1 Tax=Nitzschia inconspicua TaxID=303405 RepID=A0A9K3KZ46_9STRA|nr:tetratricopeptide repeat protein [Nitzschia inconspicua]